MTKFLAVYEEPFWRADGLSGEGFAPHQFVRELYDNTPPSAAVGVLCTFLPGENAELAGRMSPARAEPRCSRGLRSSSGPERSSPTDYIETDWCAEEWTRGAYAATFSVGGLTRFGPDLRRPVGPIHWACADIAGFGHMHMEGGVRSGEAAAAAVLGSLTLEVRSVDVELRELLQRRAACGRGAAGRCARGGTRPGDEHGDRERERRERVQRRSRRSAAGGVDAHRHGVRRRT